MYRFSYRSNTLAVLGAVTVLASACGGPTDEPSATTEDAFTFSPAYNIWLKRQAKPFLGNATTGVRETPDHTGHYRHYQRGSIYYTPSTGAHEVHGLIRQKWAQLGWERSPLRYPRTDERSTSAGPNGGRYNIFQQGRILWKRGASRAYATWGAIDRKYHQKGLEHGFLGYPRTDERRTPDGVGRYNHFDGGSIYWKPSIGAHEVHGDIRSFWASKGWERNASLGYPISDEQVTKPGSSNRWSDFENGIVHWTASTRKAKALSKFAPASRTGSQMWSQLIANINAELHKGPESDRIEDLVIVPMDITDYRVLGGNVVNRLYHVRADFDVAVPFADPDVTIDYWFMFAYDKQGRRVIAKLLYGSYYVDDHSTTPAGVSAQVGAGINSALQAAFGQTNVVVPKCANGQAPTASSPCIPNGINFLTFKVLPNGDFNAYVAN